MTDVRFAVDSPFTDEPVPEVPLPSTPLEQVIAQIRFPRELGLTNEDAVERFHKSLRDEYPIISQEHELALLAGPDGVVQQPGQEVLWRFSDLDARWKITLSKEFIAIDTTAYDSRADFIRRLRGVLEALASVRRIIAVQRFGMRYVDRLVVDDVTNLQRLIRGPLIAPIELIPLDGAAVAHSVSETVFTLADMRMKVRTALLPPNQTFDPSIAPRPDKSWILDFDAFSTNRIAFDVDRVVADAERYAQRVYRMFRWAVSDEALRAWGGAL